MLVPLLVAIDLASAVAMLGVAASFFALSRFSRDSLHLLFGLAFATLALGISTVGASEFDLTRSSDLLDGVRIVCHTAAPLMIVMGYWSVRRGERARIGLIVPAAFLLAVALAATIWIAPPAGGFSVGSTRNAFIIAHAVHFLLYVAIVVLSARNFLERPTGRRALVPLAFVAYAFSKYTWMLIDIDGDERLVPFVYFWRFVMIGLMATAIVRPRVRGGAEHGPS